MAGRRFVLGTLIASSVFGLVGGVSIADAATFQIINADGAGEGFNDATAAAPVGGNSGTTVGAQRLIAFQYAADLWGAKLVSNITIRVRAQFNPLTCSANSATLGSAGPNTVSMDFPGAPFGSTWYHEALASALSNSDTAGGAQHINAQFSSSIGTTGCLQNSGWYYGLDGNEPGNRIDFVAVLAHELGHGLGFSTLVDRTTGVKLGGFNDAYMLKLENHGASPSDYPSMTDAQRLAASTSTGNLHWIGANVRALSGTLSAGTVGDHVRMYAPSPVVPGSSVSHWDTALTPNQLMEPAINSDLTQTYTLELAMFKDIGWTVTGGGTTTKAPHNFDGNLTSDILWRNTGGSNAIWLMNGATPSVTVIGGVDTTWSPVGQRDFDGNGTTDILWRNSGGSNAIWFMNGATVSSVSLIGGVATNWYVAGTGDFDGNGTGDILWRNTDGAVAVWLMNGSTVSSVAVLGSVATNWTIYSTADFDGDGKTDILWRNTGGSNAIWLMNGVAAPAVTVIGGVAPNWTPVGTGDFNGDGKGDIMWRNSDGANAIWLMNGTSVTSSTLIGGVGTSWSVASNGDYDGDGKADILWREAGGSNFIWFMNGATVTSVNSIGGVAANWSIQNAGAN